MYHRQVSSQPYRWRSVSACPPSSGAACRSRRVTAHRLHAGARRASAPRRADRLLGGGRHPGDHGGLDHHHRDLFRVPRRRADRAHRTSGRNAIRLRGSHRRPAPADRSHVEPPAPQSGITTSRSSTRSCGGSRRWKAAPTPCMSMPDSIITGSTRPTGREQTRSVPNRPSPINDKSSGLLPTERDREPRHQLRQRDRAPASVA